MGKYLWGYVIMALLAVCMVGLLALALTPMVDKISTSFRTVSTLLRGAKQ